MAGVVGGVECSDGEERGAYDGLFLSLFAMATRMCAVRAAWRHSAHNSVHTRPPGDRTVARVVGGVECSDGKEQCAYSDAVDIVLRVLES